MKLAGRRKKQQPTSEQRIHEIIQDKLTTAYAIYPGHLMPGAIIAALAEDGFRIISDEDFDREIAAAHQAGVNEGSGW